LENVTHSLTGFFLSRAGLNRISPQATLLLILSANAPDIDILALAGGRLNYFHYHRHLTHSLIFAPVLAATLVTIFRLVQRLAGRAALPWLSSFWVALVGIGSHLLLDLTNDYGERLLLPFSGAWLALDICAIYDLWIFAIFLFCLAAPFLSDLVGGEIGAGTRSRYPSRFFPCLALILLVAYDGGRFVLHQRALAVVDARQYDGANALRVAAFPNPSNPARWQTLAETASSYRIYDLNLFGPLGGFFDPGQGQTASKSEFSPAIEAANQTEPFRVLRDFARFPLWRAIQTEGGTKVTLFDVRFPFLAEAELDRSGRIETSAFQFSR
jgi:inner membrane protein